MTSSARCAKTPDGELWVPNGALGYDFWARHFDPYEKVALLVRAHRATAPPAGWEQVTGRRVRAIPVPDFHTPLELPRVYTTVRGIVRDALAHARVLHLRAPCFLANVVYDLLPTGRPFGVEVIGDPYDVFSSSAFPRGVRYFYRSWFARRLHQQCSSASAVAYVTEERLQTRYPPRSDAFVACLSDVYLPEEAMSGGFRQLSTVPAPITVVTVGSLDQLYKGVDVLIDAVAECCRRSFDVRLAVVGDGRHRAELQQRALRLGIASRVRFLGQLPAGRPVRDVFDSADLFVLASLTEGLPKAMLEAMARGLPCIGSSVGGIPELLSADDLVPPADHIALAEKIMAVARPDRLTEMSKRNRKTADAYGARVLEARRREFHRFMIERTSAWLERQPAAGSGRG